MRLFPLLILMAAASSLAAQDLPPYIPSNPVLTSRSALRLRDRHGLSPFSAAYLTYGAFDLALTPSARRASRSTPSTSSSASTST